MSETYMGIPLLKEESVSRKRLKKWWEGGRCCWLVIADYRLQCFKYIDIDIYYRRNTLSKEETSKQTKKIERRIKTINEKL